MSKILVLCNSLNRHFALQQFSSFAYDWKLRDNAFLMCKEVLVNVLHLLLLQCSQEPLEHCCCSRTRFRNQAFCHTQPHIDVLTSTSELDFQAWENLVRYCLRCCILKFIIKSCTSWKHLTRSFGSFKNSSIELQADAQSLKNPRSVMIPLSAYLTRLRTLAILDTAATASISTI